MLSYTFSKTFSVMTRTLWWWAEGYIILLYVQQQNNMLTNMFGKHVRALWLLMCCLCIAGDVKGCGAAVFYHSVKACVCMGVFLYVSVMRSYMGRGLLSCVNLHLKPEGEISPKSLSVFVFLFPCLSVSCLSTERIFSYPVTTICTSSVHHTALLHHRYLTNYASFLFKSSGLTEEAGRIVKEREWMQFVE